MKGLFQKMAVGIGALALVAFISGTVNPIAAEAGFGIKVPKIGNVIKGSNNTGAVNNTRSNGVHKKTVKIHVMESKFNKPVAGAEVYEIRTNTSPSVNDRQAVCTIDADYKLLGKTDANGDFVVPPTAVPFGVVISVPGNGVDYQSFPDIIEESTWTVRCPMVNKVYQRVQFTGKQL